MSNRKMAKTLNHKLWFFVGLTVLLGGSAGAETNPFATSPNAAVNPATGGGAWSNGLAAQTGTPMMANPASVQYNTQNNGNGREYKASDAQNNSNNGSAAATAAGTAMISAGAPMMLSPIPAVAIAGASLVANGGIELAQAGASQNAANQNQAQNNLLTNGQGENGVPVNNSGSASSSAPSTPVIPPALESMLNNHGVNAQDFMNQLASGQLQTPGDVLKAAGNNTAISPEDLAKADQIASGQMAGILGGNPNASANAEPLGNGETHKIDYDPSGSGGLASHNPPSAGGASASPDSGALASVGVADGEKKATALASNIAKSLLNEQSAGGEMAAGDAGMLQNFGQFFSANGEVLNPVVVGMMLESVGVLKPIPKQNIFSMAHRNFRNFGKWRKELSLGPKVASKLP